MNSKAVSQRLLNMVKTELMSELPDLRVLKEWLGNEYKIDKNTAQNLLYHIVHELNNSLFTPIRKLELILTRNCNLKCSYCFEQPIRGNTKMSNEIAKKAIDLLMDYSKDTKELYITHFGGEPTLNFDILKKVTLYASKEAAKRDKKVYFNMTTNGVMLTDEMINFFEDHNIKVLLSIDGLKQTHDRFRIDKRNQGSFERVISSMQKLKKKMPWIGIKMTIAKESIDSLYEDVKGLYDLGVNQFIIGPAMDQSWQEDDMNNYFKELTKVYHWYKQANINNIRISDFDEASENGCFFGCRAARDSLSIDIDGNISGCSKILSLDGNKVVGKLGDVWHGLINIQERLNYISCEKLKNNCQIAGIADKYQGGCFASNYEETGDVFKPSLLEHSFNISLNQILYKLKEEEKQLA